MLQPAQLTTAAVVVAGVGGGASVVVKRGVGAVAVHLHAGEPPRQTPLAVHVETRVHCAVGVGGARPGAGARLTHRRVRTG